MPDPRVTKLAQVLVQYSLDLQPGELFTLRTSPLAEELSLEVYKEAVKAGAHITIQNSLPGAEETFYKFASDAQLIHVSPVRKLILETFDASLYIEAEHNTRSLSSIDPAKIAQVSKANAELTQHFFERAARKEVKWSLTVYPTHAMAQEADMSLTDYADFVYGAGMLHLDDPVAFWKKEGERQREIINWLQGHDQILLKGENVDLTFSIKGRTFEPADGKYNFPDGEVFTGPVEDSVRVIFDSRIQPFTAGRRSKISSCGSKMARWSRNRPAKMLTCSPRCSIPMKALAIWANGASAPITASSASPRICSSMKRSAARSIWR